MEMKNIGKAYKGPSHVVFQILGFGKKLGVRAFFWISGRPRAPEIHIFCLKSQFLREIPKKREIPILAKTTWEGLRSGGGVAERPLLMPALSI